MGRRVDSVASLGGLRLDEFAIDQQLDAGTALGVLSIVVITPRREAGREGQGLNIVRFD